jgi:predicted MFS family arabinose efflux permease
MKRLLILVIGSFALGLDAYIVAGILPVIGAEMNLPVSAVGQMVTVFTLAYALLSPVCATFVVGRPMRTVLLIALAVFTLGNVLSALAPSLVVLLVSRAVAGLGAGLYSPLSAAAAAEMVPAHRRGQALAVIVGGMSVGTAIGVPLGLTLAQHFGWRSTLWLVAVLGLAAMIAIATLMPSIAPAAAPSVRARLGVLTDRRVLSIVLITLFCSGTSIGMYTYVAPLLAQTLHTTAMSSYLWLWGVGGLAGSVLIGMLLDRWHNTKLMLSVILGFQGLVLLTLPLTATTAVGAALALFAWGAVGWGTLAPQQHRLLALRSEDGPVAVSLNASALYLGSSVGAGIGGALLGGGDAATTLAVTFGCAAVFAAALNLFVTTRSHRREPVAGDSSAQASSSDLVA